jgi:hypothetical protein
LPIDSSPFALTVAIRSMSSLPLILRAWFFTFSTTSEAARSMPRFRSMALNPASSSFTPSP